MPKHPEHGPACDGCQILGLMSENDRLRAEIVRLGGKEQRPQSWRVPARVSPTTGLYVVGQATPDKRSEEN